MPIYEFACPKCRVIYSFLSKRVTPDRLPVCPKCGHKKLSKQVSAFSMTSGRKEAAPGDPMAGTAEPDLNDPRVQHAMSEMERDIEHLDDNNPRHIAHMLRKMKEIMPPGSTPKEFDIALKRLESGEDPEKIEADMGEVLDQWLGPDDSGKGSGTGSYQRDSGLYDY